MAAGSHPVGVLPDRWGRAAHHKYLSNPLSCIKFQMIGRGGALHLCAVFQVLSGLKEGK
jgi:hypothetical protein